ncbi:MAG TPA: FHA domain-containing protein [Anaerolineaceae bacterium]|jgi:predicted component of type VI protein secretion system
MVSTTYQLTMRSGPTPGKVFPLEKDEVMIGRDLTTDIVINDVGVSRRHAHLVLQGTGFVLEDVGSTNGTMVGGQRLMGPYQLQSGDAFTLGDNVTLVFEAISYDPDATLASPRMAMEQPTPTAQSMPPIQFQGQPTTPPPPVYSAPMMSQPQPPQPSYSGQVPAGPAPVPPKKKKGFPVWIIIVLVIILILICVCVGGLWFIDANNMWCKIAPFIPGCP